MSWCGRRGGQPAAGVGKHMLTELRFTGPNGRGTSRVRVAGARAAHESMSQVLLTLFEVALRRCPPFVGARAITMALRLAGARVAKSTILWGMPTLTGEGDVAPRLEIRELCGLNYGC